MGAFVISKRFNGQYKFAFTSRKGKTIFTSMAYAEKKDCEAAIELLRERLSDIEFQKQRSSGGKFHFSILIDDVIFAIGRKYSTELRLQKGMDEIKLYAVKAEILDFSESDFMFSNPE